MEIAKIADKKLYALKSSDSVDLAIEFLTSLKISGLPVVKDELLLGFVDLESLKLAKPKQSIEKLIKPNLGWILSENFHQIEALKRFDEFDALCLAIVNSEQTLLGIISKRSLIHFLTRSYTISAEGSVICIEMPARNYSLNELARIIESEGTKILGVTLIPIEDGSRIEVQLKLNTGFTDRIVLSLQRFGYEVSQIFFPNQEDSDVELRYNALLKYLEF